VRAVRLAAPVTHRPLLGFNFPMNVFSVRVLTMKTTPHLLRHAVLGAFVATGLFAQPPAAPRLEFPQPSPKASFKQRAGLTDIEVEYFRPGVKGRKIFADKSTLPLQPYGEVWRVGANNPTKITFSTPVKFGGQDVPAGSYGLYAIPGADEWTVILNRIGEKDWGAYAYKSDNDAARAKVKPVMLTVPVETCTIDVNDIRPQSATLNISWEQTRVPVKLEFDVVTQLQPQIEQVMASDAPRKPYFNAAMFYYDNNLDLKKASEWIDAAIIQQPAAFYIVYRKGLILEKLGDKAGAIAAAQASRDAAAKAMDQPQLLRDEYVRLNDALIARLK
jgi:hypothetical protein